MEQENISQESPIELSLKDVSDAIRVNTESNLELSNKIAELLDTKSKFDMVDTATKPGLSKDDRKTLSFDIMLGHLSKLSSEVSRKKDFSQHLKSISTSTSMLVVLVGALQNKLSSISNSIKASSDAVVKSEKHERNKNTRAKNRNRFSYTYNKLSDRYPMMTMLMPQTAARAKKLASVADALKTSRTPIISKAGNQLGRLVSGFGMGRALPTAGLFAGIEAIKFVIEGFNRLRKSFAQSYLMEQRTGTEVGSWDQMQLMNRITMAGYSYDEALKKQMEYAKAGVTDESSVVSGVVSEKVFGAENAASFMAFLQRRTDAMATTGGDLAKVFQSLKPIVKTTGLSIQELQSGITTITDSFRGGGFTVDMLNALQATYGKFVAGKQMSWQDVSSIYNAHQTMDSNKLLTYSYFAQKGGYKTGKDLMEVAYDTRHLQGGDVATAAKIRQAAHKGVYQQLFGKNSWGELTKKEKFIASEYVLPQSFDFDIAKKMPENLDDVMKHVDKGLSLDKLPPDLKQKLEEAKKTDTERIAGLVAGIQNPLEQIRNLLFYAVSDPLAAIKYASKIVAEDKEFRNSVTQNRDVNVSLDVYDKTRYANLQFVGSTIPGKSGSVKKINNSSEV